MRISDWSSDVCSSDLVSDNEWRGSHGDEGELVSTLYSDCAVAALLKEFQLLLVMGGWSKAGPDAITRAYRMDEANSAEHHNSRASSFRGGRPPTCSGECGRARIGSLRSEARRGGKEGDSTCKS